MHSAILSPSSKYSSLSSSSKKSSQKRICRVSFPRLYFSCQSKIEVSSKVVYLSIVLVVLMIVSEQMTDPVGVEDGETIFNGDIVFLAPFLDIFHRDE